MYVWVSVVYVNKTNTQNTNTPLTPLAPTSLTLRIKHVLTPDNYMNTEAAEGSSPQLLITKSYKK